MIKIKRLSKILNTVNQNKPVFIMAMVGNESIDQFGVAKSASVTLISPSDKIMEKSLLLTALSFTGQQVGTCFDTSMLKSSVKKCIKTGYDNVHIYVEELDASARLKDVVIGESKLFLVVDWNELLKTNASCIGGD
jgi:hypothetical protein